MKTPIKIGAAGNKKRRTKKNSGLKRPSVAGMQAAWFAVRTCPTTQNKGQSASRECIVGGALDQRGAAGVVGGGERACRRRAEYDRPFHQRLGGIDDFDLGSRQRRMGEQLTDDAIVIMQRRGAGRWAGVRFRAVSALGPAIVMMMPATGVSVRGFTCWGLTLDLGMRVVAMAVVMIVPGRSPRDGQKIADDRKRGNSLLKHAKHGTNPNNQKVTTLIMGRSVLIAIAMHKDSVNSADRLYRKRATYRRNSWSSLFRSSPKIARNSANRSSGLFQISGFFWAR